MTPAMPINDEATVILPAGGDGFSSAWITRMPFRETLDYWIAYCVKTALKSSLFPVTHPSEQNSGPFAGPKAWMGNPPFFGMSQK